MESGRYIATADSEASDTKSPRFEGDAGAGVPPEAPDGVGTAPMEDVEVEEVEEEDPASTLNESGKADLTGRG